MQTAGRSPWRQKSMLIKVLRPQRPDLSDRPREHDGRTHNAIRARLRPGVDRVKPAFLGHSYRRPVHLVRLQNELRHPKITKCPVHNEEHGPRRDSLAAARREDAVGHGCHILGAELQIDDTDCLVRRRVSDRQWSRTAAAPRLFNAAHSSAASLGIHRRIVEPTQGFGITARSGDRVQIVLAPRPDDDRPICQRRGWWREWRGTHHELNLVACRTTGA
jgi:hypothetical protein